MNAFYQDVLSLRFISAFSDAFYPCVFRMRFKTAFYKCDSTRHDPILDPKTHQIDKLASNQFITKSHFQIARVKVPYAVGQGIY